MRTIDHQLSAISYQPSARIVTVNLNPVLDRTLALPRLTVGQINRAQLVRLDVGGKGFNVSRALLELGSPSLALGVLGGATGEMLRRGLEELGIAGDFVFVEGETRQNLTLLDESTGLYTKINEAGPQWTQDTVEALLAKVRERVAPDDVWVMAGRLPPGAPADLYARLITLVQSGGARAYLDSSGQPLRLACQAAPYGVKPNVEEAEEVVGHRLTSLEDLVGATRAFLEFGIQVVAISRGAQGALVAQGRRVVQAMPPAVEIRSTVGAGDAFMAGLVWTLEGGRDLAEAARWAVACGTAAAMEEGTGVGTREKFEALASRIIVEDARQ
jgi:1-phosphofructokinase family hexose kinase